MVLLFKLNKLIIIFGGFIMNKKRDIILFVSIFCILSLIAGGTYAYWSWDSGTNNSVVFNTSKVLKLFF